MKGGWPGRVRPRTTSQLVVPGRDPGTHPAPPHGSPGRARRRREAGGAAAASPPPIPSPAPRAARRPGLRGRPRSSARGSHSPSAASGGHRRAPPPPLVTACTISASLRPPAPLSSSRVVSKAKTANGVSPHFQQRHGSSGYMAPFRTQQKRAARAALSDRPGCDRRAYAAASLLACTGPESLPLASTSRSTNSITATGAESPWRKPALSTRV